MLYLREKEVRKLRNTNELRPLPAIPDMLLRSLRNTAGTPSASSASLMQESPTFGTKIGQYDHQGEQPRTICDGFFDVPLAQRHA
jgi:hypothetical protein